MLYIPPTQNPFLAQSMQMMQNIGMMYLGHSLKQQDQEKQLEQQRKIRSEETQAKLAMEGFTPVSNEQMMGDVGGGAPTDQVNIYGKSYNMPKPRIVPITAGGIDTGQVGIQYRDKFTIIPKDKLEGMPDDYKKYLLGLKDPGYAAHLDKESNATGEVRTFEQQFYGKLVPELRGTEQYKKDLIGFKADKNPMLGIQQGQFEMAQRAEGNRLRAEFNALPEVKTYTEISKQSENMKEAMAEAKESNNKTAVDQSLIMIFNKMMDERGTVRTEEYARTANDLSLVNMLKGKVQKVIEGGAGLTDDDRQAIMRMAEKFNAVAERKYKARLNEYSGYFTNSGLESSKYLNPSVTTGSSKKPADFKYVPGQGIVPVK